MELYEITSSQDKTISKKLKKGICEKITQLPRIKIEASKLFSIEFIEELIIKADAGSSILLACSSTKLTERLKAEIHSNGGGRHLYLNINIIDNDFIDNHVSLSYSTYALEKAITSIIREMDNSNDFYMQGGRLYSFTSCLDKLTSLQEALKYYLIPVIYLEDDMLLRKLDVIRGKIKTGELSNYDKRKIMMEL